MDLYCNKCGRWLGRVETAAQGVTVKCANCKTNNKYSVTTQSATYCGYLAMVYNNTKAQAKSLQKAATKITRPQK